VTQQTVTPINLNGLPAPAWTRGTYSALPLPAGWPRPGGGFATVLAAQLAAMARFSLPPPTPSFANTSAPYTNLAYNPWNQPGLWNVAGQARTSHAAWVRPGILPATGDQGDSPFGAPYNGLSASRPALIRSTPWAEQYTAQPPTLDPLRLEATSSPVLPGSSLQPFPIPEAGQAGVQRIKAGLEALNPLYGPMALDAFPHPPADNGRGMHWIPTVRSSAEVVDRFVRELAAMNIKWAVFLNDGASVGDNDYLVQQLVTHGIEPVMRVYTSGLEPISGDPSLPSGQALGAMVRHYTGLGVRYFQLYNEPNVAAENGGNAPDVNRYLDLWLPAAKVVAANGGLPGFGALSPGGEMDDRAFLRDALVAIQARGETATLDRAWLASHNYAGERPLSDPDGFLRFRQYDAIIQSVLGRSMPIIGTEGGSYTVGPVDQARQIEQVLGAYRYMAQREPYNFAYTYWVVANGVGGGHDPAWEWQTLFRDGWTSPLVDALRERGA